MLACCLPMKSVYLLKLYDIQSHYIVLLLHTHTYNVICKLITITTLNIILTSFSFFLFTATAYGQGVYFAVNPQYSLSDTYSPPDNNGHKHIYMCNVLTGMFCRGDSNMRVPPDNPAAQGVPYNSTVDDINGPKIYVSFHDANVYPAYLITCK